MSAFGNCHGEEDVKLPQPRTRAEAEALFAHAKRYVENMGPPWGHKVIAYLYFEGEPTDGQVQDFLEAVSNVAPNAEFVGVEIVTVSDPPQDQGAA